MTTPIDTTTAQPVPVVVQPAPAVVTVSVANVESVKRINTVTVTETDLSAGFPTVGHLRKFVQAAAKLPDELVVSIGTGADGGLITAESLTVA